MPYSVTTYWTPPPRGHHAAAGRQRGDDARTPVFRQGRQDRDRFAPFGIAGASQKIHSPSHTAVDLVTHGIGTHLAGEIDLQSGIDGDHLVVLRNDQIVVRVFYREKGHHGIVVDEIVECPRADAETGDDLSRMERLFSRW